jgi:hypothetical protein
MQSAEVEQAQQLQVCLPVLPIFQRWCVYHQRNTDSIGDI